MKINQQFEKTRWNGNIDMIKFTKWYEPIIYYPLQVFYAFMVLVPYFGTKFLYYELFCRDEILEVKKILYKKNIKARQSVGDDDDK